MCMCVCGGGGAAVLSPSLQAQFGKRLQWDNSESLKGVPNTWIPQRTVPICDSRIEVAA